MPEISGIDVLKVIRKFEIMHNRINNSLYGVGANYSKIIMQTASEDINDFLVSFREGRCNGYINKPYSKDEVLEKISSCHG